MKRRVISAIVAVLAACNGETGSKRFAFDARAGGVETAGSGGPLTFTNETGWTVTLTKADVTIGPVYLNVIPPLRDDTQSFHLIDLFEKNAWAQGTQHLGAGRIVGEVLAQAHFSALSSDLVSFASAGTMTQEEVRTAEVWLYPAPGATPAATNLEATDTDTVALDVAGGAVKGGETVRFRGQLKLDGEWLPDVPAGSRSQASITDIRKVRGIPITFFPEEGGHLEIRFDVKQLFRGADFSNLASNPTDKDGTKILVQSKTGIVTKAGKVTTDQVMTNLFQGLRQSSGTYVVRWIAP